MDHTASEASLIRWIRSEGGYVHPAIDLFAERKGRQDRGVVARGNIQKGEQLLLIPEKCALYFPEVEERTKGKGSDGVSSEVMKILEMEGQSLSPFLVTVLLFLGEVAKGEQSKFASYILTLPAESPPSLMTWSAEERCLLQGTSLERNADRQLLEEAFGNLLLPLMRKHPDLWPSDLCDVDRVRSAAAMVQSRVFHMKEENWITNKVDEGTTLYLIPGIDMINHSLNDAFVNAELRKCRDCIAVGSENGCQLQVDGYFTMTAERDIEAGEEILHSYGELSDAALLRIYGFVSDENTTNAHNFLVVAYALIKDAIEHVIKKCTCKTCPCTDMMRFAK